MTAELNALVVGYAGDRVGSSATLIRDGNAIVVVDPGMVAQRALLTEPLGTYDLTPGDVTDIVISHHHPDHTMNIALFPNAKVHDFASTYIDDLWLDHDEDDWALSESITLTATPGHTDEDVSTLVRTEAGLVVLTHLWWHAEGPADDPYARDRDLLRAQRARILAMRPTLIVPGHGPAFTPNGDTPV
jgi:glyoxylase-like metal-dependent hydrolase (beta-lactamase superfamily II)